MDNNSKECSPKHTWETVEKLIEEKYNEGGKLIIPPYFSSFVVFRGEPYAYEAVWEDPKWVPFNNEYALHKDIKPALRVLINVAVVSDSVIPTLIGYKFFEMDVSTFRDLSRLRDKYGLDKWIFQIRSLDEDIASPCYEILPNNKLEGDFKSSVECLPMICLHSLVDADKRNMRALDTTQDYLFWCRHCKGQNSFRFQPSPDAGPYWRCGNCGETL